MCNIPEHKVFSEFSINTDLCMAALWEAMSELKQSFQKEIDSLSGIRESTVIISESSTHMHVL